MCSLIGVSNERHEAAARRNGSNSVWWWSARGVFDSIQCKLYVMEPRRRVHTFIKTISSHQFFLVAFLLHLHHLPILSPVLAFFAELGGPAIRLTSAMCFHFLLWSRLRDQRGTKYKLNSNHSQTRSITPTFRSLCLFLWGETTIKDRPRCCLIPPEVLPRLFILPCLVHKKVALSLNAING